MSFSIAKASTLWVYATVPGKLFSARLTARRSQALDRRVAPSPVDLRDCHAVRGTYGSKTAYQWKDI